jgi:UDP-3-O-[3-hydroxymyristoyl] glucosamine N-acyltransferase
MVDPRFFRTCGPFTLAELAERAGARLDGAADGTRCFAGVASLDTAGPEQVSFLDNRRYAADLQATGAGAVILHPDNVALAPDGAARLLADAPYRAFARVAEAFHPDPEPVGGVAAGAQVDPAAELDPSAEIQAGAVVAAGARIGARCRIAANAVVGPGVVLGDDCTVGPGASLSHCLIGARTRIHAGVRIGTRGFGFEMTAFPYLDVPQLGRVIVEEDVEIGANSTVDRGASGDTVIGAGCKLDNLVQIGHNVRLGRGCVLVAQSGIAGSTELGDFVVVAAQAGVSGHLSIGRGAQIAAQSGVMRNLEAGARVAGAPAMPVRDFFRLVGIWQRLLKTKGKTDE